MNDPDFNWRHAIRDLAEWSRTMSDEDKQRVGVDQATMVSTTAARLYDICYHRPTSLTAEEVVKQLLVEVELDSGAINRYHPEPTLAGTSDEMTNMAVAVSRMIAAGCLFTREDILEIAGGEQTEVEQKFSQFDGFTELSAILLAVYERETTP